MCLSLSIQSFFSLSFEGPEKWKIFILYYHYFIFYHYVTRHPISLFSLSVNDPDIYHSLITTFPLSIIYYYLPCLISIFNDLLTNYMIFFCLSFPSSLSFLFIVFFVFCFFKVYFYSFNNLENNQLCHSYFNINLFPFSKNINNKNKSTIKKKIWKNANVSKFVSQQVSLRNYEPRN